MIVWGGQHWSYSKGDTVDAACVILTDKFEKIDADEFSLTGIPIPTINKLYVAMTRSRGKAKSGSRL